MKAFWLPSTLLILLVAACLSAGSILRSWTTQWNAQLDLALRYAQLEQWDEAERISTAVYNDWQDRQAFLRTVLEHAELDTADSLLQTALTLAEIEDAAEFCIHIRQTQVQLGLLQAMQEVSLQNLF
jgi:hypothetical protein